MAYLDKDFCIQKIDLAIALVDRLLDGDHPHNDTRAALNQLRSVYSSDRTLLRQLDDTAQSDTVLECCRHANVNLVRLKEFIGFLLRSTNIRNAFELYFPTRLLATELLGRAAPVVLGSEWSFSPYTYPLSVTELPDFVFIGVPASECQNPLIMPLAGHELGHVVWRQNGAQTEFEPLVRECVLNLYKNNWEEFKKLNDVGDAENPEVIESDLFITRIWGNSYRLACRQLEETFCDCVGIYLFGRSFLNSFRYLLAPSLGQLRGFEYPRIDHRVAYMLEYANSLGLSPIESYSASFNEGDPRLSKQDSFVLRMADEATESLHTQLPAMLEKYKAKAPRFDAGGGEESRATKCLMSLIPPVGITSVAAIVNAARSIRLDIENWHIRDDISDADVRRGEKVRILTDLVLKSFEVYEFQKRVTRNAP